MAEPKIKYDIEAAVKGEADAQELANALREVGDVLEGDLQQSALEAARALESLSAKQRAVDDFARLKREAEELSAALGTATRVVDQLGAELPQASANTQTLAAAESRLASELADAQASLARKKDALKQLREETTGAARKTDEFKTAEEGLKAAIKATQAEVNTRKTDLRSITQGLQQATAAEAALRKEYDLAIGVAAKASAEVANRNRKLEESRSALNAAGISTNNLVQADRNLQAAVAQVRQEVAGLAPAYQQAAAASSSSTQVQAQNQRTLREGMTSISTQLQRIQQIATVALGGSYAGGLAKDVADTADQFRNLQARVGLATGEGDNFQTSWAGVTRVALQTNSALEGTGTLFARLVKAAQEGGASAEAAQARALQLTQTINQAVQLSGSSADASNAAVTQLIQGLQSGVLRGEEFNSVMEQAPRLAEALANGLGVTTGKLREMAQQGQLTAEVVMKALQGQADVVATEFGKLPPTVGRALQNLTTAWTLYIGESDKGLLSSANAAKAIDLLAQNLDVLISTLTTAGKLWAAIKIAGLVADFGRWATQVLTATAALEANTIATGANTAAQTANAAAQAARAAGQGASTAATVANTAAQAANASAWASIATFTGQATRATASATAAVQAGTTAAAAKTAQMGLLGRAVGGVTGMLGGPVGLAATALLFSGEIKRGIVSLTEWAAGFTEVGKRMKETEQKLKDLEEAEKRAAESRRASAAATEQARAKLQGLTADMTKQITEFDKLREKGDSANDALSKIGKDFDLSTLPGIRNAGGVLDGLVQQGKITASQFEAAWASALNGQDLNRFETMARAAFDGTTRGAERLAQVMDATLREAINRTGLDFDVIRGGMSKASISAINDVDKLADNLGRLKATGVDVAKTLEASLTNAVKTADSVKAVEALKERVQDLRNVLGAKVADGLLEQLQDKLKALDPQLKKVSEAFERLGITTREEAQKSAKQITQDYYTALMSGKATAEGIQQAWIRMTEAQIKANGGVVSELMRVEAAQKGLAITTDQSGSVMIRKIGEVANAWSKVGKELENVESWTQRVQERNAQVSKNTLGGTTFDKQGFETNTAGQRVEVLVQTLESMKALIKERGGTDAQAEQLAPGLLSQWNSIDAMAWRKGMTTSSISGMNRDWNEVFARALESAGVGQGATSGSPPPSPPPSGGGGLTPAPSPAPTPVRNYVTNITLDGWTYSVNTASQQDQNVLTNLLRELDRQKGSAS